MKYSKLLAVTLIVGAAALFCGEVKKNDFIAWVFFSDAGDFTPNSEYFNARRGILRLNTDTLKILLDQMAEKPAGPKIAIIASTALLYNLYLAGTDPLSEERVRWWMEHGPRDITKWNGVHQNKTEFASFEEAKTVLDESSHLNEKAQEVWAQLPANFNLYTDKAGDFVVILQKVTEPVAVGLLPDQLIKIEWADAPKELEKRVPFVTHLISPSIDNFSLMVDRNNDTPKHVLLRGHGHFDFSKIGKEGSHQDKEGVLYARLNKEEFQKFLNLLNGINVLSLYVWTCFSGGSTIPDMFAYGLDEHGKLIFDLSKIKYLIVMGATSENMMLGTLTGPKYIPDWREYFVRINNFMRDTDPQKMKYVLAPLRLESFQGANTPSMRFAGNELFRVASINEKAAVFTETKQSAIYLEHHLKYGDNTEVPIPPINIKENTYWYYYPFHIRVPLFIEGHGNTIPDLTSLVQGKCIHIFDDIRAKDATFSDLASALAGKISTDPHLYMVKKISCVADVSGEATPEKSNKPKRRGLFDFVLFLKTTQASVEGSNKKTDAVTLQMFYQDPASHKYFAASDAKTGGDVVLTRPERVTLIGSNIPAQFIAKVDWKEITPEEYRQKISGLIAETIPSSRIIAQSSGGRTIPEMVKKTAEDFIAEAVLKTEKKD